MASKAATEEEEGGTAHTGHWLHLYHCPYAMPIAPSLTKAHPAPFISPPSTGLQERPQGQGLAPSLGPWNPEALRTSDPQHVSEGGAERAIVNEGPS